MGKPIIQLHSESYRLFTRELVGMRERAGITQRELARRINQSASQVGKHELGERRVDVVELRILCEACGESVEDFVRRWMAADPRPPEQKSTAVR